MKGYLLGSLGGLALAIAIILMFKIESGLIAFLLSFGLSMFGSLLGGGRVR